jgi:hypothetical protein
MLWLFHADDCATPAISFPAGGFKYFGTTYSTVYATSNNVLTFGVANTGYVPQAFPISGLDLIALYWTDSDTRGSVAAVSGQPTPNTLWYRMSASPSASLIARVTSDVASAFPDETVYTPTMVAVFTYFAVGYYNTQRDKLNTFQVVISSDGLSRSFVTLCYDNLVWDKGTTSNYPLTGFNSGSTGRYYSMQESFTASAISLSCGGSNGW